MNLGTRESVALARGVMRTLRGKEKTPSVVIFPSFTVLNEVRKVMARSRMRIGAQNCGTDKKGAYTGEVSISMLEDVGCEYVLVGHSERRFVFGESLDVVSRRFAAAIASKLTPVLCVGEPLEERDAGNAKGYVGEQLTTALKGVRLPRQKHLFIAYEPVWAIGSDHAALVADMVDMHEYIKDTARKLVDVPESKIHILYGGSVNAVNAYTFLREELVDGVLVGGASLKIKEFQGIVDSATDVITAQEL
jgi:triosephosphate isomerase (TIM)